MILAIGRRVSLQARQRATASSNRQCTMIRHRDKDPSTIWHQKFASLADLDCPIGRSKQFRCKREREKGREKEREILNGETWQILAPAGVGGGVCGSARKKSGEGEGVLREGRRRRARDRSLRLRRLPTKQK